MSRIGRKGKRWLLGLKWSFSESDWTSSAKGSWAMATQYRSARCNSSTERCPWSRPSLTQVRNETKDPHGDSFQMCET